MNQSSTSSSGNKANLDAEQDSMSKKDGMGVASGAAPGAGSVNKQALNPLGYLNGEPASNPTNMSDEEKKNMLDNFERTKSEYQTDEDDSLFKVVSKTYIRNLDKILTLFKTIINIQITLEFY